MILDRTYLFLSLFRPFAFHHLLIPFHAPSLIANTIYSFLFSKLTHFRSFLLQLVPNPPFRGSTTKKVSISNDKKVIRHFFSFFKVICDDIDRIFRYRVISPSNRIINFQIIVKNLFFFFLIVLNTLDILSLAK